MARLRSRPGVSIGPGCCVHPAACFDPTNGGTVRLGRNVQVCAGAILSPHGGSIELGDNTFVGPYCVLYGHGGLAIGHDTMIAAHTVIVPANHGFARTDLPIAKQPIAAHGIEIGADCWIACGCRILDGVSIGPGSVIGAGAVVTTSIPAMSVAVGVPARVVRARQPAEPAENVLHSLAEQIS